MSGARTVRRCPLASGATASRGPSRRRMRPSRTRSILPGFPTFLCLPGPAERLGHRRTDDSGSERIRVPRPGASIPLPGPPFSLTNRGSRSGRSSITPKTRPVRARPHPGGAVTPRRGPRTATHFRAFLPDQARARCPRPGGRLPASAVSTAAEFLRSDQAGLPTVPSRRVRPHRTWTTRFDRVGAPPRRLSLSLASLPSLVAHSCLGCTPLVVSRARPHPRAVSREPAG